MDDYANSGDEEIAVFQANPSSFYLLPNHHEIEKVKPPTFFYSNERNNFYVQSQHRFRKHLFDEVVSFPVEAVEVISRKELRPLSPSSLPLTDNSTKTGEKLGATGISVAGFSVGEEVVVAGVETADFSVFPAVFSGRQYAFQTFYHPYTCEFIKTLNTSGIEGLYKSTVLDIDGLLKDGTQNRVPKDIFNLNGAYNPTPVVASPYPTEQVDFNYRGVYSIYNWELFFHIPLLIATRLSQNQKFDEARKWFHYIYDPTRSSSTTTAGTERFWVTNPFKEEIKKGILSIEELLNTASPDLDLQLKNWEHNPFQPHAVARLRVSAYMRSTVMKYIENLIAWGDQLFQQDTIESINEATLLYVLGANILGDKSQGVPARAIPEEKSFSMIEGRLDSFGNAKVAIQSFFSLSDVSNTDSSVDSVPMTLFCIPKNDFLLGYWDTVADRLFKIRHCLNIEGVFRQLPLFEPPIDPALLVRASAAGLDLSSVLNDVNMSLPNYRFQVMLQKANELCNDVKGLGSELLAALEKNDAEQLSLLRSSHELNMLEAVRDIKVSQRDEANENLESLNRSNDMAIARRDYYGSRAFTNASEELYFSKTKTAASYQELISVGELLAGISYLLPDLKMGSGFTIGATFGGANVGNKLRAASQGLSAIANLYTLEASQANILGGYQRRQDDWIFQTQTSERELKQIEKQIAAAQIRLAIAEKDLQNHDLQRDQSKEVDDYLKSKFTNEELYDYMVGEISSVYFQSYQLAYNTAKNAQKCFEFELGLDNTSFIQFGYWDSLKKGLLAGEKLQLDLRRLENAYLEQNRREFELTKTISLLLLDPRALVKLRETGRCPISLPEEIFDLDYPGHYFRRIKSVSISIPCILGPYPSISCTLRLGIHRIRINTDVTNDYPRTADDPRFIEKNIPVAIAASNAQNDSGMFELSFRDERYLPFEGTGAISEWSLELFNDSSPDFGKPLRQFDYSTISDVILHVKYTAREGPEAFKNSAITNLRTYFAEEGTTPSMRMFNLRQEFPTQWHRFLNPTNPADGNIFELQMSPDLFRILDKDKTLSVNTISLYARCADGEYNVDLTFPTGSNTMSLVKDPQLGLYFSKKNKQDTPPLTDVTITPSMSPITWQLKMTRSGGENLHIAEVEDVLLILGYEWQ